ncbi:DUF3052 family protein [Asticcacaulis excentricus]|uniref:DUF3052 domain-containing protein n=1 Tax=Asticcacaulis excentricus (strain ATCC 15261 / DSM 4724 / KCTC 12464 / NCIMB 9791 / VKM B-1370 / CB 48) TaxID=573065 RepID=E8RNJ6_ASTEC|nr:DUF3052 family protein [Asticcacaulis excentricus]ADU11827.1 hypothetical protein Astex_0126 [Asticcacaulis excentricus CB 48]
MTSGYSGTPLAKKLGYKPAMRAAVLGAPNDYKNWLEPLPDGVEFGVDDPELVHIFATERAVLETAMTHWRGALRSDGMVWVSWPKKASKVPTDITEDVIREVCLPLGFVDVKVCAVSNVWSGLKLVVRKELR